MFIFSKALLVFTILFGISWSLEAQCQCYQNSCNGSCNSAYDPILTALQDSKGQCYNDASSAFYTCEYNAYVNYGYCIIGFDSTECDVYYSIDDARCVSGLQNGQFSCDRQYNGLISDTESEKSLCLAGCLGCCFGGSSVTLPGVFAANLEFGGPSLQSLTCTPQPISLSKNVRRYH